MQLALASFTSHAVVDLPRQKPTAADFVRIIVREMKIRFYSQKIDQDLPQRPGTPAALVW